MSKQNGKPEPWKDRFIKREIVTVRYLLDRFHDKNWRIHVEAQRAATEGSLNDLGWIDEPKIAQGPPEVMFDGHLRVELAMEKYGLDGTIPANWYDLTRAEADQAILTLDPIAAMAAADREKLAELMQNVSSGEAGLQAMFAELAERERLFANPPEAPEDFAEYDEEIETEYCCPKCGYQWSGKPK